MRPTLALALICLAAGCEPTRTTGSAEQPDSIVLERTPCVGTCPAYRLSLARSGTVHFRSLNPGDSARTATDVLPRSAFERLARQAEEAGIYALPDSIIGSYLCAGRATDYPFAVVTLFDGSRTKRVVDYLGCAPGPILLRRLGLAIDSTAASGRWVHAVRTR